MIVNPHNPLLTETKAGNLGKKFKVNDALLITIESSNSMV